MCRGCVQEGLHIKVESLAESGYSIWPLTSQLSRHLFIKDAVNVSVKLLWKVVVFNGANPCNQNNVRVKEKEQSTTPSKLSVFPDLFQCSAHVKIDNNNKYVFLISQVFQVVPVFEIIHASTKQLGI